MMLPVTVANPAVIKLPPVTLPVAVTNPSVDKFPPVTVPTAVNVELPYIVPVTATVCNGAALAKPTLPELPITVILVVGVAVLPV